MCGEGVEWSGVVSGVEWCGGMGWCSGTVWGCGVRVWCGEQ